MKPWHSEARRLREEGETIRSIAHQCGVSTWTVRVALEPEIAEHHNAIRRNRHKGRAHRAVSPDSPRLKPSVPFVRCLAEQDFATFQMVQS